MSLIHLVARRVGFFIASRFSITRILTFLAIVSLVTSYQCSHCYLRATAFTSKPISHSIPLTKPRKTVCLKLARSSAITAELSTAENWRLFRRHWVHSYFSLKRILASCSQDSLSSRMASPAPLRLASRISEYLRDRRTPGAPARNAASTASFTLCGVHLLLLASVGMSISTPGQI